MRRQHCKNEITPHGIGLPDGIHISFGLLNGYTLVDHSIKKAESRGSEIDLTMQQGFFVWCPL